MKDTKTKVQSSQNRTNTTKYRIAKKQLVQERFSFQKKKKEEKRKESTKTPPWRPFAQSILSCYFRLRFPERSHFGAQELDEAACLSLVLLLLLLLLCCGGVVAIGIGVAAAGGKVETFSQGRCVEDDDEDGVQVVMMIVAKAYTLKKRTCMTTGQKIGKIHHGLHRIVVRLIQLV